MYSISVKKCIKTICGIGIFLLILGNTLSYVDNKFGEANATINDNISYSLTSEEGLKYIHKMTNTVIVSNDIWGKKSINEESLQKAMEYAKNDEEILSYLNDWKYGNFDYSVEFHNYVWRKLNGNVGKAYGLNEKAIENARKNLGF